MLYQSNLGILGVMALASISSAQVDLSNTLKDTGEVKNAGVYHMATGEWTRKSAGTSHISPCELYDNTCTVGYFLPLDEGDTLIDSGRIPSTCDGGKFDDYRIECFSIAYCSYNPIATNIGVAYYDCYSACGGIAGQVPIASFSLLNLPAGGPDGSQGCWIVTIDLTGTTFEFEMEGDCDGCYDNVPSHDNFGWSWTQLSATVGSNAGPILAGDPFGVINQECGGVGDGTDHPGLGSWGGPGNAALPGTGIGIDLSYKLFDLTGGSSDCFWFGGYSNSSGSNPLAAFYHKLWGLEAPACAQSSLNLVPNPSFEEYTGCPSTGDEIGFAAPWDSPTTGTSNYFNGCATTQSAGVPTNNVGSQSAKHGDAYGGFFAYHADFLSYREYLQVPLNTTLVPSKKYEISFYVSRSDNSAFAIDSIGAYFHAGSVSVNSNLALPYTPQVVSPTGAPLSNATGWTKVSGSFTAGNWATHMLIGNFLESANTNATLLGGSLNAAYYYVDQVCVMEVPQDSTKFCFGDGSGTPCPGGVVGGPERGCPNSNPDGLGGQLCEYGTPIVGTGYFGFTVTGTAPNKPGIMILGCTPIGFPNGNGAIVGSAGIFCVNPKQRGSVVIPDSLGNAIIGDFQGQPFWLSAEPSGAPTYYQFWQRDPGNPNANGGAAPSNFNFTNAVMTTWVGL